ncbi:MAG: superoxide dismutase [Acidobacteriota bacterium]
MAYELQPLGYAFDALEPFIDAKTMEIHHDKHHQTYVTNLNNTVANHPDLQKKTPLDLVSDLQAVPEEIRTAVRNNGGGVVNHNLFWMQLKKDVAAPTGKFMDAVKKEFQSLDGLKDQMTKAALGRFGSGWAWLILDGGGKLAVTSTANQDTPASDGHTPLLTVDVWEHAYYLKYQNRRADYLAAWWNVINWNDVVMRYEQAVK